VSVNQIIEELSKLTSQERSAVKQRLRELEEQDELLFLHEAADATFQEIDKRRFDAVTVDGGSRAGRKF
jgi:hypothetical protein